MKIPDSAWQHEMQETEKDVRNVLAETVSMRMWKRWGHPSKVAAGVLTRPP